MYSSIVRCAYRLWVCLTNLHATTGVDPVRGATCLPHKDGGIPLTALPKDTASESSGLFSTLFISDRAPSREAVKNIFKVFWYHSTWGNEHQVYRLRTGRSNHYAIAPVKNESMKEGNKTKFK